MKISCLIFSKNDYRNVKFLIKKLKRLADEIVVIDSSNISTFKKLKKMIKRKNINIVWTPPLGIPDFYYRLGIRKCKYRWIFHLDSDEKPSDKLLEYLYKLKKKRNAKAKVYQICRRYSFGFSHECLFRFFNKNYIYPTGLIHWVWASKTTNIERLSKEFYIFHIPRKLKTNKAKLKNRIYTFIESYQIGCKLLDFVQQKFIPWFYYPRYFSLIRKFYFLVSRFGKIGFILLLILFILAISSFHFKIKKSFLVYKGLFSFLFLIFNKFHHKYLAYLGQHKLGVYDFLEIEKTIRELSLDELENLKYLFTKSVKKFYKLYWHVKK